MTLRSEYVYTYICVYMYIYIYTAILEQIEYDIGVNHKFYLNNPYSIYFRMAIYTHIHTYVYIYMNIYVVHVYVIYTYI